MHIERTIQRAGAALRATIALAILVAPSLVAAQGRGVQFTPEENAASRRVLVNKDVGADRFAISKNPNGTLTGNVFRTDGRPPVFLFCTPLVPENTYSCNAADPCQDLGSGPDRGIQRTPDLQIVLANKDVDTDRFAISLNHDDSVTGNVFRENEPSPSFIFCTPTGAPNTFACSGADTCVTATCIDQYTFIANVTLPSDFFEVPFPCNEPFTFTAEVELPPSFFIPPAIVTFTVNASEGVQGFTINVTYPTSKGSFSGTADGVGCSADGGNFVANDKDDGNMVFVVGNATDLTFPIAITCTFDENEGQDLQASDIATSVPSLTQAGAAGNTAVLSVGVSIP